MLDLFLKDNCDAKSPKASIVISVAIISHLFSAPFFYLCYKLKLYVELLFAVCGVISSFFYHALEFDSSITVLGGDSGAWHEADNIFVVCQIMFLLVSFLQLENEIFAMLLKFFFVAQIVLLQTVKPWDNKILAILIVIEFLISIIYILIRKKMPSIHCGDFQKGIIFSIGGAVFFVIGLDDQNDPCRLFHNCWHLMAAGIVFFIFRSTNPLWIVSLRDQHYKTPPKKISDQSKYSKLKNSNSTNINSINKSNTMTDIILEDEYDNIVNHHPHAI